MVVHLSWELQERGSGSTVSLTFGYKSLRRSTIATWEPEEPAPAPPALPLLACELVAKLLCEVIFPFTELSKYETPSLHFAFTLLSAIWWWKKQKRTCLPACFSSPNEPCTASALFSSSSTSTLFFVEPFCFSTPSRSRKLIFFYFSPLQSSFFVFLPRLTVHAHWGKYFE